MEVEIDGEINGDREKRRKLFCPREIKTKGGITFHMQIHVWMTISLFHYTILLKYLWRERERERILPSYFSSKPFCCSSLRGTDTDDDARKVVCKITIYNGQIKEQSSYTFMINITQYPRTYTRVSCIHDT